MSTPGPKPMIPSAPMPFASSSNSASARRYRPRRPCRSAATPARRRIWRSGRSTGCSIHRFPRRNANVASEGSPRGLRSFPTNELTCQNRENEPRMAYNYAINDNVLLHLQGPQGRDVPREQNVYTITARLPIEADGRPRYRVKSQAEKVERVVTEEQISQVGRA